MSCCKEAQATYIPIRSGFKTLSETFQKGKEIEKKLSGVNKRLVAGIQKIEQNTIVTYTLILKGCAEYSSIISLYGLKGYLQCFWCSSLTSSLTHTPKLF